MKMTDTITSKMQFNESSPEQKEKGLLGWVSFDVLEMFRFNAVAVRENKANVVSLSYPANVSSSGKQHHYVRPLNDEVRIRVEDEILGTLGYSKSDEEE